MYFVFGWGIAITCLAASSRFMFASQETLRKSAKTIGTDNPLVARILCVFLFFGGMALFALMCALTYDEFSRRNYFSLIVDGLILLAVFVAVLSGYYWHNRFQRGRGGDLSKMFIQQSLKDTRSYNIDEKGKE